MDASKPTAGHPDLEDWSVESEIGSGGGGTVYVVRHRQSGDRAALKVPTAWNDDTGAAAEIAALSSMKHQHIVELLGTVRTDGGQAILMEYLPGGSVGDLVAARGPLTLGEAVTVIAPIAGALAFLHDRGGVHGDIAPGNVLFTAAGMPKLADLGLAVLVGGRQTVSGTPGFRAPTVESDESGGKRLRPARDVFSLAALTWYMVTGRIAGPTQQRPPLSSLLGTVPDQLVELLEDGLSEDEGRRPDAAEFSRRIFDVAAPQPVSLRDAVRPEALPHMVTRVVGAPSGSPRGNLWTRIWARTWPHPDNQRTGRQHAARGALHRRAGASAAHGGTPGERAGAVGGIRRRTLVWGSALGVVVLACLGVVGVGALNQQQASLPASAAQNTPQSDAPAPPAGGGNQPGDTSAVRRSGAAHSSRSVQETEAFRAAIPSDPLQAAKALSARRDLALSAADATALRRVHARRGASLGPDLAKASQLRSQGAHYEGLKTSLSEATVRKGGPRGTVDVDVTSTIDAYQVIGADGAIVANIDDRQVQRVTLRLARSGNSWLIAGVLDAPDRGAKQS